MTDITINLIDEVYCVIPNLHPDHTDTLFDLYGPFAKGYVFHPLFKLRRWDGKIRFFQKTGKTYINLLDDIIPHLVRWGYKVQINDVRKGICIYPKHIDSEYLSNILKDGNPIVLDTHQVELVNALFDAGYGIGLAATNAGKAQPLNSKVLTISGWKLMGDLNVGDIVLTPSGTQSRITNIYPQGYKDIYEITCHDGSKARSCIEHLWKVKFSKAHTKEIFKIVSLKSMIYHIENYGTNISIPLIQPIQYPEQILDIDPWLLGVILGDGGMSSGQVTITSIDEYIVNRVEHILSKIDLKLVKCNKGITYSIVKSKAKGRYAVHNITAPLKRYNLLFKRSYEKHIPIQYKQGSIQQRLEIIQGLMDTDGTVGSLGEMAYTTTSYQLALDVKEIILSLGGFVKISKGYSPTYTYKGVKKSGRLAYNVRISYNNLSELVSIPRKKERCTTQYYNGSRELVRRITSICRVSNELAQCIEIDDPNHLYITDDYLPTHNTFMCAAMLKRYHEEGLRGVIIVPDKGLVSQTHKELNFCGVDTGILGGGEKDLNHIHLVSTWQTLQNSPNVLKDYNLLIVDECHGAKGNVIGKLIREHCTHMAHRFGVTGTLPKDPAENLSVISALGPVQYTISSKALIDKGWSSKLQIEILQFRVNVDTEYAEYLQELKDGGSILPIPTLAQFKDMYFADWNVEKAFLATNKDRMQYIADMIIETADKPKGNVLCLVSNIKFGKMLTKLIDGAKFMYGAIEVSDREEVYNEFKTEDHMKVIANAQIAATGLNIPRIFNLMYIDMGKSFIRTIQAIGRGLRKAHDKDSVVAYDICADSKYSKRHLAERVKFYKEAGYPYKKTTIDL